MIAVELSGWGLWMRKPGDGLKVVLSEEGNFDVFGSDFFSLVGTAGTIRNEFVTLDQNVSELLRKSSFVTNSLWRAIRTHFVVTILLLLLPKCLKKIDK